MIDSTELGRKVNNGDLDVPLQAKELDLETARRILETLRDTRETTFNDSSDLSRIGGYPVKQVQEAFFVVAKDVAGPPDAEWPKLTWESTKKRPYKELVKPAPQGWGRLFLYSVQKDNEEYYRDPNEIVLYYYQGGETVDRGDLRMSMSYHRPMGDFSEEAAARFTAFASEEHGTVTGLSAEDMLKGNVRYPGENTMDSYRRLFSGMRWLAANLLNWRDGDFIPKESLHEAKLSDRSRQRSIGNPSRPALSAPKTR